MFLCWCGGWAFVRRDHRRQFRSVADPVDLYFVLLKTWKEPIKGRLQKIHGSNALHLIPTVWLPKWQALWRHIQGVCSHRAFSFDTLNDHKVPEKNDAMGIETTAKMWMKQRSVCCCWWVMNAASWASFHAHWSRSLHWNCLLGPDWPWIGFPEMHATDCARFP